MKSLDDATPEEWDAASNKEYEAIARKSLDIARKSLAQPAPKPNELPFVWPLVMKDMATRDFVGYERYDTRLQPHNGRDALVDAYQEALDLCVYLRQVIYERDAR